MGPSWAPVGPQLGPSWVPVGPNCVPFGNAAWVMVNIINFIQNVYFVHTTYKQNDIIALERINHMNMENILPTDPIIPWHRFYGNLGLQKYGTYGQFIALFIL